MEHVGTMMTRVDRDQCEHKATGAHNAHPNEQCLANTGRREQIHQCGQQQRNRIGSVQYGRLVDISNGGSNSNKKI